MRKRVVVTGIGVVCPAGVGWRAAWENVLSGRSFVRRLRDGDGYADLPTKIAATLDGLALPDDGRRRGGSRSTAPSTRLALMAAREAVDDSGIFSSAAAAVDRDAVGVSVGVGMVDLEDVSRTADALRTGYNKVSPYFVPRVLLNSAAGHISMEYGARGPNHAASTACATGAHAIGDGFRFVQMGAAAAMICGAAESCVSPLSVAAFGRMRALSTRNGSPETASRPFDVARDGFVMGEGAAMVVLEELDHARRRGARIHGEVLGYGLSGDAAHPTAPPEDGQGALLSMSRAVRDANLDLTRVTYVNAHATSTPLGDAVELTAIRRLFGSHSGRVHVSSTKGAHGHLLGSAGSLESVFAVLACRDAVVPPTANLDDVCREADGLLCVGKEPKEWKCERRIALKNSFGFGGTNASLCFSNYVT